MRLKGRAAHVGDNASDDIAVALDHTEDDRLVDPAASRLASVVARLAAKVRLVYFNLTLPSGLSPSVLPMYLRIS